MKFLCMGVTQNVFAFSLSRFPLFGNRIVTAFSPRMTAANPLRRQKCSFHRAMLAHRVHRVNRARRRETTTGAGTEQKSLRRRNRQAIYANSENQNVLKRVHVSF